MEINRNNYEAWLLDLTEGSLTEKQVQQLRDFLMLNPDCALEGLAGAETWILEAEKIAYSGKDMLRRELPDPQSTVSGAGFDLFSIAMLEGDLTHSQEAGYLRMIENDAEKMKEWLLWKRIRLTGEWISFDRKEALKRSTDSRPRVIWISIAAAAAVFILFFSISRMDQGFNPRKFIPVEAERDIEPQIGQKADSFAEEAAVPAKEQSTRPAPVANKPSALSIMKHQDAPELISHTVDATSLPEMERGLQGRPLRVAMLEKELMKQPEQAKYDRIKPLDLPPLPSYSELADQEQVEEEGLARAYRDFMEERNISLLSIASAGVDGINRLSGSDLSLDVSRDQRGEVSGFRFRSGILSVDSPIRKQNISR
jgi:hypothetical protein